MPLAPPAAVRSTLDAVGNTPLLRLDALAQPGGADVYVKLESFNPTASYKDRMARAMIVNAEERGMLRPGMRVVEYSGGSTGSSLAFVCAVKEYPLTIVSSDAFSQEKLKTMRAFGAEVEIIPSDGGAITGELIAAMVARARALAARDDVFFTDQFNNSDAEAGYIDMGRELVRQMPGVADVICAGVGTGGMLMGAAAGIRETHPGCRVVALEPASSPLLTGGSTGMHRVEGIGVGFVPPRLADAAYDEARAVDESRARATARELARRAGVLAGTSSGLNVAAALDLARELGPGHNVVTAVVDSGLKYLAGDLFG
jgi:cysteine synthase A